MITRIRIATTILKYFKTIPPVVSGNVLKEAIINKKAGTETAAAIRNLFFLSGSTGIYTSGVINFSDSLFDKIIN